MATLEVYRRKRDFRRTPEPEGGPGAGAGGAPRFVVHKHDARRPHYDLRLEHDGVLESWAVPKGPSLVPGEKRLAVRVEDHPLEYGDFEGVIPKGEYGGGTVMLWDRGHWRQERRGDDRLDFELRGHKLRGRWTLARMGGRGARDGANWLLVRRRDPGPGAQAADVRDDESVATGRTMAQIAADRDRAWTAAGEAAGAAAPGLRGARGAAPPEIPRPQLASPAAEVPGGDWLHEIKFDGYRILARLEGGRARLYSRNGHDWTGRFPELASHLARASGGVDAAVLDGEVVAFAPDGTTSFTRLQEALAAGRTEALVYQAFDLLHRDGDDLRKVPQKARKEALASLLAVMGAGATDALRYTDHVAGQGRAFLDNACRLGLEGILAKRAGAPYQEGRNRNWIKVKCTRHAELVIGGYTEPRGRRRGFGALLLGSPAGGRLAYAGKVGTGFGARQLDALHERLRARETADSPFATPPPERGAHWVRPDLVAEVAYTERTGDGRLRHPVFRGLREDKSPGDVRVVEASRGAPAAPRRRGRGVRMAGVPLSNPDRVLYPEQGLTKLALARYYEDVAPWILPGLRGRPLSLVRCPQGRQGKCFFQKHPGADTARGVPRAELREKETTATYLHVRGPADLVALAQAGVLELHVWGSTVDDPERPDLLVLDLDPGPSVPWERVTDTAAGLRERLAELGLASFPRTTGGKGLHVVAPLAPAAGWDAVKAFARGLARAHARDDPRRLTVHPAKARREGRIYIDYLRNGRGATAVASYSTRAREGAPVAVPVRWDELVPGLASDRYDVASVRRRLAALRSDPWDGFAAAARPLTGAMLRAVGARP